MRQQRKYSAHAARATVAARLFCACLFAIVAIAAPTFASQTNPSFLVQADASDLAPGAYRWDPSIAPDGPMNMVINLMNLNLYHMEKRA